jgi:hypothetical protein
MSTREARKMSREVFALLVISALSAAAAEAAEPAGTMALACKGRSESGTGAGSNQISKGVILDFQTKIVSGLSDGAAKITGVSETTISFSGSEAGLAIKGTLDRVTGTLLASSIRSDPETRRTTSLVSYDLRCRRTERLF